MSAILLSLSGYLVAGEKGGNNDENPREIEILHNFESLEQCYFSHDESEEEILVDLCKKLENDPELSSTKVNGISADREFETRRKFKNNCCY